MSTLQTTVSAAVIQMVSGTAMADNVTSAQRLITQAVQAGAQLISLPENWALMGVRETDKLAIAEADGQGVLQAFMAQQAQQHGVWLLGGTIPVAASASKVTAKQYVYAPTGACVARYDKLHLFDVQLADGETYRESNTLQAGTAPVICDTPWGKAGLSVCYDVRFPELYRYYSAHSCAFLTVPSAFTYQTGQAHWMVLLRARAIENQSFILAANQGSGAIHAHQNGRHTYGHSAIVSPWGKVLACCEQDGEGFALATLELDQLTQVRAQLPALTHRRF